MHLSDIKVPYHKGKAGIEFGGNCPKRKLQILKSFNFVFMSKFWSQSKFRQYDWSLNILSKLAPSVQGSTIAVVSGWTQQSILFKLLYGGTRTFFLCAA